MLIARNTISRFVNEKVDISFVTNYDAFANLQKHLPRLRQNKFNAKEDII